ncbi:MAG: DUF177 domain-containing protein [Syntrophales bacterium]|nr:DUF177 domain-containing protein [Syntrophales bacterium]
MKINVLNIPDEGLNIRFALAEDAFCGLLPEKGKLDFFFRQVDVSGFIRKVRDSIFFEGNLETVLETQCCRCLEEAYLPLKAEFSHALLPEDGTVEEEIELKTEDLEVGYYSGEVIDLVPIILEQILLHVPIKILCDESCKGLCSHCGINLNMASCDCRSGFIDGRLSALKRFKVS